MLGWILVILFLFFLAFCIYMVLFWKSDESGIISMTLIIIVFIGAGILFYLPEEKQIVSTETSTTIQTSALYPTASSTGSTYYALLYKNRFNQDEISVSQILPDGSVKLISYDYELAKVFFVDKDFRIDINTEKISATEGYMVRTHFHPLKRVMSEEEKILAGSYTTTYSIYIPKNGFAQIVNASDKEIK